jgi:2-furoyl-CoA dehydrogenase large subunit
MDDGTLRAFDIDMIDDVGAYVGRGPLQMSKPTTAVVGPYRVEAVRYGGKAVVTNKTNQAPFRGFGQACHNFILERSVDRVARALGIDRAEIRRRNYIQPDEFPYRICSGATYDSGNFPGAMAMMADLVDLPALEKEKARARDRGVLLGVGVAGCLEPSGGNQAIFSFINERSVGMAPETARIQIDTQGSVVATIGFQSTGQSHESMVRQILCHELGVEPADVRVQRGDSLAGITGTTPLGSRMTMMLTRALVIAAGKVRAKLTELAAFNLGVAPADIERDGATYAVAADPSRCLTIKELAHIAYHRQVQIPPGLEPGIVESGTSTVPGGGLGLTEDKRLHAGFPSVAFSVHVPVVEVDEETFEVRIREYYVVHDCGTVINPLVVEGMVYGGIAHGIGGALFEKFAYDEGGQPVASSFMDYLMPTAAEMPPIRVAEQVTPSPLHPYGAKGTGEGGYMTAPAAIASAVEDALAPFGVEIDEIPMAPNLLFARCGAAAAGVRS